MLPNTPYMLHVISLGHEILKLVMQDSPLSLTGMLHPVKSNS